MAQKKQRYAEQCIREYLDSGFTLFPCSNKKIPLIKGWNKLAFDNSESYITLLVGQESFGVLLAESDIVLDWDLRRDDIQASQLKEFIKLLGYSTPLKTLIVKTAGGGLHVYLKKSPKQELVYGKFLANYPAIEVKKIGNYVIGAGSVIGGVQYKIVRRG
jgi:Bifunctional DNA primase/polymerase, N-terminal